MTVAWPSTRPASAASWWSLRQRKGRTLPFVFRHEDEGVDRSAQRVRCRLAVMHADEASHGMRCTLGTTAKRINHSVAFSDDGACTNQAESFFSRLRRMVRRPAPSRVSAQYLHQYAAHAAWLEDHRRLDNGTLAHRALGLALDHGVSRQWKGYWQRSAA